MMQKQGGRPVGPYYVLKKRKRAKVETPAVTEVRFADEQAPPPGRGEEAPDRISLIPDAILGEIVSLLPTKEGARTQVLASRWRHIWCSAPLNLDCGGLGCGVRPTKQCNPVCVLSRILTSHQAPVHRLRIPTDHGCTEAEAWVRSPNLNNLQELEFCYVQDYGPPRNWRFWGADNLPLPPASTFCFSATLRLVNIGKCHLPESTIEGLHFPQLKHLALHWVRISECSIHRLISGCPALDCLLICYISGLRCLRINAVRLRSIGVRTYLHEYWKGEPWLDNLVIENAPCLERLLRLDLLDSMQVSVISAPKLESLGSITINEDDRPSFSMIIQRLRDDRLTRGARLVKILAVHMPYLDLDIVIDLIRCFPCLEKLYIQDEFMHVPGSSPKNLWRRKYQKVGCLGIHVKTIVLETYVGIVSDVNFVTFFVLNAKELELMTIQVERIDEKFIVRHQKLLQLKKKASRGARLQFTTDRRLRNISDICHVHDLDLTDPFLGRF